MSTAANAGKTRWFLDSTISKFDLNFAIVELDWTRHDGRVFSADNIGELVRGLDASANYYILILSHF